MTKSKTLILIAISFALGILLDSVFNLSSIQIYFTILAAAVLFFFSFHFSNKLSALLALFLFCASLGALRMQSSMAPNSFEPLLGQSQTLEGYVVEDPSVKINNQLVTFKPEGFKQNIQINIGLTQSFFYGDKIVAVGKVDLAKNFDEFDYQSYLERYNIYASMNYPKVLILKSHQLNPVKEFLLKIKYGFISKINSLLNEPQSSLALGILIGGHGALPKDTVSNFNNTGTSHIIAVSGFNITIIAAALAYLAYVFGRRASFYVSVLTILGFVIIAGASASVVRAAIMGFLFLLSSRLGRQYSVAPSLFFAALVMLIINPKILFWDVGFQLSFAATLGIVYFSPLFEKLTAKWPKLFGIKTIALTTFAAILPTLPIILFNFGTLSLSAPLVNVLVLPFVPITMFFGFCSVLPIIGSGFAFIANWLLIYILKITEFFAHLPYSFVNVKISILYFWLIMLWVVGFYFGLSFLIKRKSIVK